MNTLKRFIFVTLLLVARQVHAVDQAISLKAGWNAIWLEVDPRDSNGLPQGPSLVFDTATNSGIEIIASPKPLAGLAETFGANPGSESGTFNQDSWESWLRSDQAGTNNLVTITGNRAYLIKVAANLNLTVSGEVMFHRHQWIPDRYNLHGFGMAETKSFDDFFGPSGGRHPVAQIYTLGTAGNWATVAPGSPVEDGVAYWIFSKGISDYMGPVSVELPTSHARTFSFGSAGDAVEVGALQLDLKELVFTNLGGNVAIPEMELIEGDGALELYAVNPVPDSLSYAQGNQLDSSASNGSGSALGESVAARSSGILTIGARRTWTSGLVGRTNVYRLSTGGGNEVWLPVSASNSSLQAPTETYTGTSAGLWVGDVIVNAASSVVEDGAPVRPSSGTAPLRIILHADDLGAVKLLNQVTLMQTKSADLEVPAVPVLVVDQARIPFFEGVRERGGKKVGVRIESIAYDMPRKFDAVSQDALLNDPAFPGLNEAGISNFLIGRDLRPPSLAESYHLSWDLSGSIGPAGTVSTSSPLTLDPFHRSNPFRHAFHQRHAKGTSISRTMELVFSSESANPDQLSGTYRETISGLTKQSLILEGEVTLRRVSSVAELQGVQ